MHMFLCIVKCLSAYSNPDLKAAASLFITYADALITNLIISQSLLSGGFVIHCRESYSAEINEPQIIFPLSTVTCNLQPQRGRQLSWQQRQAPTTSARDAAVLTQLSRPDGRPWDRSTEQLLQQLEVCIFLTRPSITIKPEHTVFLVLEAIHSNSGMGSIVFGAGKNKYKTPKS